MVRPVDGVGKFWEVLVGAKLAVFAVVCGLFVAALPVFAHHSFAAEYDATKPITLKGVVTKMEWMNPHARFYVDVKDESGTVTNWELELTSPNGLKRNGWGRNSLKPGDEVTVTGFLAKDGSKMGNARTVVLSDGRKVFAGSADGGPTQ